MKLDFFNKADKNYKQQILALSLMAKSRFFGAVSKFGLTVELRVIESSWKVFVVIGFNRMLSKFR